MEELAYDIGQRLLQLVDKCKKYGFRNTMSKKERRKHYLRQAKKHHPDLGGNKEMFQDLQDCI